MSNVEVMKRALEVMHYLEALNSDTQRQKVQTITELKGAISKAEKQEPAPSGITLAAIGHKHFGNPIPKEWYAAAKELLATPPEAQQEWIGLTEEEVDLIDFGMCGEREFAFSFAKEVEARLKEKNTKPLNWKEEKNSLVQKVSNQTCTSVDAREEFGFAPMSLKGSNYKVRGF
jgi:hypothetical protein